MPRLTWNDKLTIEKMLKQKYKAPAIARYIGVSTQAIYDEIKRGAVEVLDSELRVKTVYAPEMSRARHEERQKNREQPLKIGKDRALAAWLVEMIGEKATRRRQRVPCWGKPQKLLSAAHFVGRLCTSISRTAICGH